MSLSQAGPDPWCKLFSEYPNDNAQLLLQEPKPGVTSGPKDFEYMSRALTNARLQFTRFDSAAQALGQAGYQEVMSWDSHMPNCLTGRSEKNN